MLQTIIDSAMLILLVVALCLLVALVMVSRRRPRAPSVEAVVPIDWKTMALEEERKRLEILGVVEAIQKERDTFKDLWWQCSLEHGAAQRFMADEIMRCYRLLKKNNINVKEKPDVLALPGAYEKTHGLEELEKTRGRIECERSELHQSFEAKAVAKDESNA